ncbi:MAG: YciI family protein [Bacillota bacterium]
MLFAWIGFMKAGSETVPQEVQHEVNDFLQQPYIPIHSVGPLCDESGRRAAMLMIFEADDRTTAEALVANSPYMRAGLYETYHLYEFRDEIG